MQDSSYSLDMIMCSRRESRNTKWQHKIIWQLFHCKCTLQSVYFLFVKTKNVTGIEHLIQMDLKWGKENRKTGRPGKTWQVRGCLITLWWNMASHFLFCKEHTLIPGSPFSSAERPVLSWLCGGCTGVKLLFCSADETWGLMWGSMGDLMFCRGWKPCLDPPTSASKSLLLRAFTPLRRALLHRFLSLLGRKEGEHVFFNQASLYGTTQTTFRDI